MKSFYLFLIFLCSIGLVQAQGNRVIVKGFVKYSNGTPVINHRVTIATDSTVAATQCHIVHQAYTNANGFYTDTLQCSSPIVKLRITTANCNGTVLINSPQVPPAGIVESNFTLNCNSTPSNNCVSYFTYSRQPNSLVVEFNSASHGTTATDNIVRRRWKFGDGDTLGGNAVTAVHTYAQRGVYQACLTIWTATGCEKTECKTVTVTDSIPMPAHCKALFTFLPSNIGSANTIKFNSSNSTTQPNDNIRERIWKFGDGTTLGGNNIDPQHTYAAGGAYNVCLIIRTIGGCSDTTCLTINIPTFAPTCHARFTYEPSPNSAATNFAIKFNSSGSETQPGDTIRERIWSFGDGTSLAGNVVDPRHEYARDGLYTVCLTIKTARGCVKQECKQVVVTRNASQCAPRFTYEKIGPKKIRFNSAMTYLTANDTIVERVWQFGDGTSLAGNVVGPIKEYLNNGVYTVCLKIKTARGCQNTFCSSVRVGDSTNTPINNEPIRIVSLYPTPATVQLTTMVWSLHNNVSAQLAVYDIYGVQKWATTKVLLQGNTVTVIPTSQLLAGPYYFRVTTMYGTKSRLFYKL